MSQKLAYSATGKALLAGGYLVLVPEYSAYVVALSARMHAVIQGSPASGNKTIVTARSPQFAQGEWRFEVNTSGPNAYQAVVASNFPQNPFLEYAITVVLSYLQPIHNYNIDLTIYSDDGYHSQDEAKGDSDLRFHSHDLPIHKVPKTGLGSSAALTAAVTAALLGFYRSLGIPLNAESPVPSPLDVSSRADLVLVHNLAQLAHCTAQGKIGSGFDVAAAVFGSLVYRRFPAAAIAAVADLGHTARVSLGDDTIPQTAAYLNAVRELVDAPIDDTTGPWAPLQLEPCAMPRGLAVLMGDVRGGSETPKLVSTILQWRKDKPEEAGRVWTALNAANMGVVSALAGLRALEQSMDQKAYDKMLADGEGLSDLKKQLRLVRKYLKEMTNLSQVPVEPEEQTQLLDACAKLPGVVGGVVPGAGGYDAISLVVVASSISQLKEVSRDLPISWLDLREQSQGLIQEDPEHTQYHA